VQIQHRATHLERLAEIEKNFSPVPKKNEKIITDFLFITTSIVFWKNMVQGKGWK